MQRKPLLIRLPLDIKAWVQVQATDGRLSQNSFIVQALQKAMRPTPPLSGFTSSSLGPGTEEQVE
jgi:hypothetical protein